MKTFDRLTVYSNVVDYVRNKLREDEMTIDEYFTDVDKMADWFDSLERRTFVTLCLADKLDMLFIKWIKIGNEAAYNCDLRKLYWRIIGDPCETLDEVNWDNMAYKLGIYFSAALYPAYVDYCNCNC